MADEKPGRPSRPPPWSTRPTSGWSAADAAAGLERPRPLLRRRRRGHAPHPRSTAPATRAGRSGAAAGSASTSTALSSRTQASDEELSPSTRPCRNWPARNGPCAELVKLRFFAGLTLDEAAAALGIARRTANRYWAFARAWLFDALRPE